MKNNTHTPDLKPGSGTFKLERGSIMPEMGPLIRHIGHLRPVYAPLRFITLEDGLYLSDLECALCDWNRTLA